MFQNEDFESETEILLQKYSKQISRLEWTWENIPHTSIDGIEYEILTVIYEADNGQFDPQIMYKMSPDWLEAFRNRIDKIRDQIKYKFCSFELTNREKTVALGLLIKSLHDNYPIWPEGASVLIAVFLYKRLGNKLIEYICETPKTQYSDYFE